MRISINAKVIEGAWGGSNQAVKIITEHLKSLGYEVTSSLRGKIDLILMIHPNKYLKITSYGIDEICKYIALHPNTILVHRVNTSDQPRGTATENKIILEANQFADYTIFVSSYLKELYIQEGFDVNRPHVVILNGADEKVFNPNGRANWKPNEKLKVVTHHWSNNYMKGFDIYERFDLLLGTKPFSALFEFTFIGRIPIGLNFKHTNVIPPLADYELAKILKQHHIYLTASRNEPAGMHYIEGMRCGLPVLYLNSGSLPEYCSPYGVEFNLINFEQKLLEMRKLYPVLSQKVLNCPYTGEKMATEYIKLFEKLLTTRKINPIPRPNLTKVLKQYFFVNLRRLKRWYELLEKVKIYLRS